MFDLGITEDQELKRRKQEEENEEEDENSELPLYNPAVSRKKDFIERPYNLRPRNRKNGQLSGCVSLHAFVDKSLPCVCHHSKNLNLTIISTTCINQTIPLPSWLKIDQNVQLQNHCETFDLFCT